MDELLPLTCKNSDLRGSAALCFSKTWLSESTGLCGCDTRLSAVQSGPQQSGEKRGGRICFYINEEEVVLIGTGWCLHAASRLHFRC
ncbi:hypothetical protein AMECASPLE_039831 [Ameca splendens]|uniref:Uncharacterized protein n=1 Tax=Ameca splendens TaxID=208324 RepID=A0ABV0XXK0_9TELE